jgi:GGDEF domain-containing protein
MRRAQAWLFVGGGLILLAILAAPDRDPSDHTAVLVIAVALLALAGAQFLWRGMPDWVLLGFLSTGIVSVSLCVGLFRPMVLTPVFYIWSFLLAANYLSRRQIAFQYGLMVVTYGAALTVLAEPQDRSIAFLTMTAMIAIVVTVVLRLRERNERLVARLRETATCDSLTGALNRGAFEEHLRAERARSLRNGRAVRGGDHRRRSFQAGQRRARACSRRCRPGAARRAGAGEHAGRGRLRACGGEEFALLLADTDLEQAAILAEGLRGLLRRETAYDPVPLTVSIGVAAADADGQADVMLAADRALYGAKRAGRDRVMRGAARETGVRPALAG